MRCRQNLPVTAPTAPDDALATADVLVLLVDHNAFKAVSGDAVRQQYVVDTKGVWR